MEQCPSSEAIRRSTSLADPNLLWSSEVHYWIYQGRILNKMNPVHNRNHTKNCNITVSYLLISHTGLTYKNCTCSSTEYAKKQAEVFDQVTIVVVAENFFAECFLVLSLYYWILERDDNSELDEWIASDVTEVLVGNTEHIPTSECLHGTSRSKHCCKNESNDKLHLPFSCI